MRQKDRRSREIIEIIADVVSATSKDCTIVVNRGRGFEEMSCPTINYAFGNGQYVKDRLDELSKTVEGNAMKFPLIVLFCPFKESHNLPDYYSQAEVNMLMACSSNQQWSNEQRLQASFQNILRPIYRSFINSLKKDGRLEIAYDGVIPHEYTENYSIGRYGGVTPTGDKVSEPIDAINITKLKLKVKQPNCRNL